MTASIAARFRSLKLRAAPERARTLRQVVPVVVIDEKIDPRSGTALHTTNDPPESYWHGYAYFTTNIHCGRLCQLIQKEGLLEDTQFQC